MVGRVKAATGVATIEFLLVVPLLILLFLGIMSLSLAAALRADLHMVARAGVQWAISSSERTADTVGIIAAAQAAAVDLPVTVEVNVETVCGCLDTATGEFVVVDCGSGSCPLHDPRPHAFVRVSAASEYPFPWAIPGLPDIWQLDSSAAIRIR